MERIEKNLNSLTTGRYALRLLVGGTCIAMLQTGCGEKEQSAPPPPTVEVVTVVQKDVPIYKEWVGALDGYVNAVIRPQVTGYLIKQNYREGELVKKGQMLFEIDPRTFQAALDQAKGQLAQQKARHDTAKANLIYHPDEPRFHVIYQLRELTTATNLRLEVLIPGDDPVLPTATGLFLNANWHERELWDMFGLKITGHPDLRRILLPEDWQGHPLRRDYPLGYEEVEYTFNFEEIEKKKPYAKD